MKNIVSALLATLVLGAAGCGDQSTGTTEGERGEKLTVAAPKKIELTQGDQKSITVGIRREKFNDTVKLEFAYLPEGVVVADANLTLEKDKNEIPVKLVAGKNAKVVEGHKIEVIARRGNLKSKPAELVLTVNESEATRKEKKQAFKTEQEKRLGEVDKYLGQLLDQVEKVKPEAKVTLLRTMSELYQKRVEANKKIEELAAASPDKWQTYKEPVTEAVNELNKAAAETEKAIDK